MPPLRLVPTGKEANNPKPPSNPDAWGPGITPSYRYRASPKVNAAFVAMVATESATSIQYISDSGALMFAASPVLPRRGKGPLPPSPSPTPSPGPSPSPTPSPGPSRSTLYINEQLLAGSYLLSDRSFAQLVLQESDGNLVLRNRGGSAVWSTHTQGHPKDHVVMQSDGNLVAYNKSGAAVWSSNTARSNAVQAQLQDDCCLVLKDAQDAVVWSSATTCSSHDEVKRTRPLEELAMSE